jgi:hypothetical protein
MATWYVRSTSSAIFQQSHLYTVTTDKMVPVESDAGANVALARKWVWQCTTGGTSAAANPTWPASVTQDVTTVTSNTAVFTARKPGFSSGTTPNWSFATCFLAYATSIAATGDTIYVSQAHSENSSSNNVSVCTFGFTSSALTGPVIIQCANDGAAPPTASALTGVVANTSTGAYIFNGNLYCYGLTFKPGNGSSSNSPGITLANTASNYQLFDNCTFDLNTTGSAAVFNWGSSSGPGLVVWLSVNVNFGSTGQGFQTDGVICKFRWNGGITSGSAITALFNNIGGRAQDIEVSGVNLSSMASSANIETVATAQGGGRKLIRGCILPSAWSGSPITGTLTSLQTSRVEMYLYDVSSGTANNKVWIKDYTGEITTEGTIVRVGGATAPDGTQMSWKFVSTANTTFPFVSLFSTEYMELVTWVNDTNSHTYTVSTIFDNATGLTNAQMWMEAFVLNNTAPLYAVLSTRANDVLATPSTNSSDSGSTWNGTGGFSNPNKQKMSITFTAAIKGPILFRIFLAKASTTVYVDPFIQIT